MLRSIAPLSLLLASAHARLPQDAPPLPPPDNTYAIVNVSTAQQLADACWNLSSNTAIVLAAGNYDIGGVNFPNGIDGEEIYQKRIPQHHPDHLETCRITFPSGRTADEVVLRDAAGLAWVANLGCIDLNPHPVLAGDLDHPDELRVDLDPVPGVEWPQIIAVALQARTVLSDFGLTGWAKLLSAGRLELSGDPFLALRFPSRFSLPAAS